MLMLCMKLRETNLDTTMNEAVVISLEKPANVAKIRSQIFCSKVELLSMIYFLPTHISRSGSRRERS